jgi:hypothetical protein
VCRHGICGGVASFSVLAVAVAVVEVVFVSSSYCAALVILSKAFQLCYLCTSCNTSPKQPSVLVPCPSFYFIRHLLHDGCHFVFVEVITAEMVDVIYHLRELAVWGSPLAVGTVSPAEGQQLARHLHVRDTNTLI